MAAETEEKKMVHEVGYVLSAYSAERTLKEIIGINFDDFEDAEKFLDSCPEFPMGKPKIMKVSVLVEEMV